MVRGRHGAGIQAEHSERFPAFYPGGPARPVIWCTPCRWGETRALKAAAAGVAIPPSGAAFVDYPDDCNGPGGGTAAIRGAVVVAWLPYGLPFRRPASPAQLTASLGILMETEIWFHLVGECQRSAYRFCLPMPECRPSRRAATPRSRARPGRSRQLERGRCTNDRKDAERLRSLGARDVEVTGNLKV